MSTDPNSIAYVATPVSSDRVVTRRYADNSFDAIINAIKAADSATGNFGGSSLEAALISDVEIVEDNITAADFLKITLWPKNSEPDWSMENWKNFKYYFALNPTENWHVWTDWWEDRRDGKPYNIEMEREIVLIPDEDWQQGPANVNAMIAEIRARYAAEARSSSKAADKQQIIDLLHTDPLRMAMVDFTFDDMTALMRAVPFPEDNANLEDPSLERDRKELLSSLQEYAENLAEDMRDAGRNSQDCAKIARDLDRYARETRKRPPRARMLWMKGADLNLYRLSRDIYPFLPEIERQKLDAMVELHLELIRLYYRGALARLQGAEVLELTEVVSLADLNGMISEAVTVFDAVKDEAGAHVEPEAIAALRDLAEQTTALIARLEEMNPEERERSEKHLWAKTKAGVMTVARVGLRMKAHAADFAELDNVDYQQLMERILSLLPKG